MVEDYVLARKVAADKCGKESSFYPFMVCALYGLFRKYDGYQEMIANLFSRTLIIFEEGKVEDILRRNQIELDVFDPVHDEDEEEMTTYGVSNQGHSFYTNEKGEVSYVNEDPFVVCSLDHENMAHLLNTFCHEMGHLIKGEENGTTLDESENHYSFIIRTGLAHYVYHYQDHFREFQFISAFAILDEAINCIQTTEVMEEILALNTFAEDLDVSNFLKDLNPKEMMRDRGYEYIVKLVRKLWNLEPFRKKVEENIVSGDIDEIINSFNSLMGEDAFEDLSQLLDEIYEQCEEEEDSTFDRLVERYDKIVNEYEEKSKKRQKVK